jgi:hypothetical protein
MGTVESSSPAAGDELSLYIEPEYHRQVDREAPRVTINCVRVGGYVFGYLAKSGHWVSPGSAGNDQILYDNDEEAAEVFSRWLLSVVAKELETCTKPPGGRVATESAA